MIELCCEYLSVWCTWLYVFAMSRSLFRVNTVQAFYFYSYFYLFKNDLVDFRTPRNWGWHFIKKINTVLHKMLKLGFQNFTAIFLKNTFLVATFFLYLGYLFELIFALLTFADKGIIFVVSAKFPMASKFNFSQQIFKATSCSIYPQLRHNLKENVDQRKTNLGWCYFGWWSRSRKIV